VRVGRVCFTDDRLRHTNGRDRWHFREKMTEGECVKRSHPHGYGYKGDTAHFSPRHSECSEAESNCKAAPSLTRRWNLGDLKRLECHADTTRYLCDSKRIALKGSAPLSSAQDNEKKTRAVTFSDNRTKNERRHRNGCLHLSFLSILF
jgi:hypothetical protein